MLVLSGAAGLAFFLNEAARLCSEPTLLETAARFCELAERLVPTRRDGTWARQERFFEGRASVAYARILVSHGLADPAGVAAGLDALERSCEALSRMRRPRAELFVGAAGLVCAAGDLLARLPRRNLALRDRVRAVGDQAFEHVWNALAVPLARHDRVGMAHGLAGQVWGRPDLAADVLLLARTPGRLRVLERVGAALAGRRGCGVPQRPPSRTEG